MSRGRLLAAALALSLLVAGCSGGDDKKPAAGAAGSTSTTQGDGHGPGEDPGEHTTPTLVDPKTGKQGRIRESDTYTAVAPPPVVFRAADIGTGAREAADIPLEASITPACVEHGQEVTAVMKSDPGVTLVAQIKWPNEQFSGLDNTSGKAGPDGTLTWKVRVQPTALYGQADLMVAVIDEGNSSRKGTSGSWLFVVTPPGRC